MKHLKKIGVWLGIAIYMMVVLGFVSEHRHRVACNQIEVVIEDSLENRFVGRSDLIRTLEEKKVEVLGKELENINTKLLEEKVLIHPAIHHTQAYKTLDGRLWIQVVQREPLLRVISSDQQGAYIDKEGKLMALSLRYTAHVPIANGHISWIPFSLINDRACVDNLSEEDTDQAKLLEELYLLADYIQKNEFWNAMIEQVYVNSQGEFELVPRLGSQIILFGTTERMEEKFRNLKLVYKKGIKYNQWNQYSIINVKYKNQVICTKSS